MAIEQREADAEQTGQIILEQVRQLATELRPALSSIPSASLDSLLDRELGFDSLGRVELISRIERALGISLPEHLLTTAETPRDLMRAVQQGVTSTAPYRFSPTQRPTDHGGANATPASANSLLEVLEWHGRAHPARPHIYLVTQSGAEEEISYAALRDGAAAVAAGLRERDLRPGQTVAIMLPTGRDYFYSFYGVLMAGGIPVPIYPPMRVSQIEEHLRRHGRILANAGAVFLITFAEVKPAAQLLRMQVENLHTVIGVEELTAAAAGSATGMAAFPAQAQDIALLQYTSGSTGNPKGVILTHANLLANLRAMGNAMGVSSADVFVSWMPLYHDMGLIGAWLGSLYYGMPLVVMSPLMFLTRPERWLWAIDRHRATLSGAPNFGYELCLQRIQDRDIEGLDLSTWRLAFNGAEPVSPDTITRFHKRFSRHGFRVEAMAPVYGLAESSLGIAFPPPGRAPVIDRVQRKVFMLDGRAWPADTDDVNALRFVACGRPLPGHQIRIVDGTGHEVAEREEGRLEISGPSVTSGYFRNPEETRRLFHDAWLDSGDLAYMAGGDVYLTGRVKDVIIRAGRNIYPHELEEAVGNIPGIRKGCVAVFGSQPHASTTEKLVVLAETREAGAEAQARLRAAVNATVMGLIGTLPDEVVLAPPYAVLKTSSGKVRRAASRNLYERGGIGASSPALWRQYARLIRAGVLPQLRRILRTSGAILYAVYAWTLFCVLAVPVWATVILLPRETWARKFIHVAARCLLRLSGTFLRMEGIENLPQGPCVVVANHASYLDGIVLTGMLAGSFSFVVKREITDNFIAHVFLRHIGAEFVDRLDLARGVEDARQLVRVAREGRTLVFFPEGTFTRSPGLLPFYLGAFVAAAEAGVPVVPVTLRGTRSILRDGQWFPRHGTINLIVGRALQPEGTDWIAALRMREAARAEILRHCGEPDLAHQPPGH